MTINKFLKYIFKQYAKQYRILYSMQKSGIAKDDDRYTYETGKYDQLEDILYFYGYSISQLSEIRRNN